MISMWALVAGVVVVFWAISASAKEKTEKLDPLAAFRTAEAETTKAATETRISALLNKHSGMGKVRFVMTPEMQERLEIAMSKKFYYEIKGPSWMTQLAGPFISQAQFREWWMPRYGPGGPKLPYDPDKAAEMAWDVAAHIRFYRGWYVPEYVAEFQKAAGLLGPNGVADGLYGGRTMGALCFYIKQKTGECKEGLLPTPVYEPTWMVKYRPPLSRQV